MPEASSVGVSVNFIIGALKWELGGDENPPLRRGRMARDSMAKRRTTCISKYPISMIAWCKILWSAVLGPVTST